MQTLDIIFFRCYNLKEECIRVFVFYSLVRLCEHIIDNAEKIFFWVVVRLCEPIG